LKNRENYFSEFNINVVVGYLLTDILSNHELSPSNRFNAQPLQHCDVL